MTEVQEFLATSPYQSLSKVTCDVHCGAVRLSGVVPSFYLKQMAQSILLPFCEVYPVLNEILVREQPIIRR